MKYLTRDGETFEGETARDCAAALRALSRKPGRDLSEWIAATAAGASLQTGHHVRSTTAEALLEDLERAGLIERIDE